MTLNLIVIAVYMAGMVGIGFLARARARTKSDFLVAGRRLGPFFYAGTMAALVMGGGATLGGIGLGYQLGLSGVWLVFSLAIGVFLVSMFLAPLINRLKVYTVAQMLQMRYGNIGTVVSGAVMLGYTLFISVTSTTAYGAIFSVLFDIGKVPAILLGSGVVVLYSVLGGMWSITLTDVAQFLIKTLSIFFVLLPVALIKAGGFEGLSAKLPESAFDWTAMGGPRIFTYLLLYVPTMIVGQDLWQRIFTARSDRVARWAGVGASLYCFLYGIAGALIGMSAAVLMPGLATRDEVYTQVVNNVLPAGLAGLVVAGALAAIMGTSSGALIATATVAKQDVLDGWKRRRGAAAAPARHDPHDEIRDSRLLIVFFGVVVVGIACAVQDVITALTLASDFLVGGLMVPVLGGMLWKRATGRGAIASIVAGIVATMGTMLFTSVDAYLPVYVGLAGSFAAFVLFSLLDEPTPAAVMQQWAERARPGSAAAALRVPTAEGAQP
ncbi:MAG: sodium:solute symporter [Steroidobacteraceae bacterium]